MDAARATGPDPLALYRAQQSREMDRRAIDGGIPGFELMCRAGEAAFAQLQRRWPQARRIEVFCGGGNNGGDGYVVAALAKQAGLAVRLWALSNKLKGDAAQEVALFVFDTLMVRAEDEPDAVYGLLAETVKVSEDGNVFTFNTFVGVVTNAAGVAKKQDAHGKFLCHGYCIVPRPAHQAHGFVAGLFDRVVQQTA